MTATVWLTVDEVTDRTTLQEPEIKKLIAAGEFPSPVQGEDGARVWRESDIDEWISARPRDVGFGRLSSKQVKRSN